MDCEIALIALFSINMTLFTALNNIFVPKFQKTLCPRIGNYIVLRCAYKSTQFRPFFYDSKQRLPVFMDALNRK